MLKTNPQLADALPATAVDDNEVIRSSSRNERKSAKSDFIKPVHRVEEPSFLTPDARWAFTQLRQAFTKAPILRHFVPERHIQIETDASGYAIGGILSQMTSKTGQWYLVAYYLQKMILAKMCYKTHNAKLLAIVEAFKNWRHYLEGCQYEFLVLTDHNNLHWFINTKSLSSCQVRWAQELFHYHFHINYRQGKANRAADALSRYPQQSQGNEEILQAENTRILQRLQFLLTNACVSSTFLTHVVSLKYVIICETHIFPNLFQSWEMFRQELVTESPNQASIRSMRLRLVELQAEDGQAQKIRVEKLGRNWEDSDRILHHQGLLYISEIIRTELISRHYDEPLTGHFGIEKTQKLVARKYY